MTISAVGVNGERSSYSLGKVEVEREQTTSRKAKFEQSDIDEVLIAWNGNPESKRAVYEYMLEHESERDTAAWLANEYGAEQSKPLMFVSPTVEEEMTMPWAKVQRRIAQLIHSGDFLPEAEREQAEKPTENPQSAQENEQPLPDYTSETVAVYPAESNNLPFDVVLETLHFDELQRPKPAIIAEAPSVEQNVSATPPIPAKTSA